MPNHDFIVGISKLYDEFKQHDATQISRIQRFRNIEPDSAQFLSMLIRIQQPKLILEIGTSTGYSTLWLAEAAQGIQAKIITLEIDEQRSQHAQKYAQKFGLEKYIEFWVGDAADYLEQHTSIFDFILLDAERREYVNYWQDLKRLLRKNGGILIVDNVISHKAEVKDFLSLIEKETDFMTTTLALGAGLFMVVAK